jgi:hypothetical protein
MPYNSRCLSGSNTCVAGDTSVAIAEVYKVLLWKKMEEYYDGL